MVGQVLATHMGRYTLRLLSTGYRHHPHVYQIETDINRLVDSVLADLRLLEV